MMKNEKISIIVPVYNVEKYIKKNIESLIRQSYSNFEVIYIDDGSTDNSLSILNEYKLKDDRIQVIHTNNYGVSHSRNLGIDLATGKYITFIDGDDYVDEDYLEYLISIISKDNLEIGISLEHHINDDLEQPKIINYKVIDSFKIIENIYLNRIYMAVWNKIYDRVFLEKNNIKFEESLWYAEGMHFNIQCLSCTKKVAVGNKKVYHYISNPNSAMRKGFNIKNEKCALKSLELQRNILINKGITKCKELEYHYMMVEYMIYAGIIENNLIDNNEFEIKKSLQNIKERKFIPLQVNLSIRNKITWLLISMFPIYMTKRNIRKKNKELN